MPNPGASPEDAAPKDEGLEGRAHFPLSAAVEHNNDSIASPGNSAGHKTLLFSALCICYLLDLVRFSQAGFWADFSSLPLGPRGQDYQGWTRGWLTSRPGPDTGIPARKSVHLLELP